tara:strand:- start:1231 stop:1815 length:585 start_codon:yes stop_codon:yes gene_type:complete
MRNERTFDAYSNSGANAEAARKQSESLIYNELGQRWQYMLTLRIPRQSSDRLLLQALEDYFVFLEIELQKDIKRRRERVRRSVYVHTGQNDYHAHVYSKYPRSYLDSQKDTWDLRLLECWYKTSALRGHCPTNIAERSFLFHHQPCVANIRSWAAYGIKNNTGNQAWIDDLSYLHHSMNNAIKKGVAQCRIQNQ